MFDAIASRDVDALKRAMEHHGERMDAREMILACARANALNVMAYAYCEISREGFDDDMAQELADEQFMEAATLCAFAGASERAKRAARRRELDVTGGEPTALSRAMDEVYERAHGMRIEDRETFERRVRGRRGCDGEKVRRIARDALATIDADENSLSEGGYLKVCRLLRELYEMPEDEFEEDEDEVEEEEEEDAEEEEEDDGSVPHAAVWSGVPPTREDLTRSLFGGIPPDRGDLLREYLGMPNFDAEEEEEEKKEEEKKEEQDEWVPHSRCKIFGVPPTRLDLTCSVDPSMIRVILR